MKIPNADSYDEEIIKRINCKPFVNLYKFSKSCNPYEQYKFEITHFSASISHPDNVISILVDWRSKHKDGHLFKYVKLGITSYGYFDKYVSFEFPVVINHTKKTKDYTEYLSLDVGLETLKMGENSPPLDYSYHSFDNTKYGVIVYFTPQNWRENQTEFFTYNKKEK